MRYAGMYGRMEGYGHRYGRTYTAVQCCRHSRTLPAAFFPLGCRGIWHSDFLRKNGDISYCFFCQTYCLIRRRCLTEGSLAAVAVRLTEKTVRNIPFLMQKSECHIPRHPNGKNAAGSVRPWRQHCTAVYIRPYRRPYPSMRPYIPTQRTGQASTYTDTPSSANASSHTLKPSAQFTAAPPQRSHKLPVSHSQNRNWKHRL